MGRPTKSLTEHYADGTFEARKHEDLLDGELEGPKPLRGIQSRFRRAKRSEVRRKIALEYEKAARAYAEQRRAVGTSDLDRILLELGPPNSAEQVINFFPRFYRWDDGSPFVLNPYQVEFITEAYRRDEHDRRIYKIIGLEIARGNGKTPIASGLGTHALCALPGRPKIFQAAGSKGQAGIGVEYAANWVADSDLRGWLRPRAQRIVRRDGRGEFAVMPAAGGISHGRKPLVAIVDEWWMFTTYAQTQVVTGFETALHKELEAYLLGISTAGYDKTSQLGEYHERAMKSPDIQTFREGFLTIARDPDAGLLWVRYGMPDGFELDIENDAAVLHALKLANPGSWVNHDELLRALRRTPDVLEWMRLALNAWTVAKGAWLEVGWWKDCRDDDYVIPKGATIYVAVDAADSYDTTAVSWCWHAPDGRLVVRSRVWSTRREAPHDVFVSAGTLDNEKLVEPFIHGLARRYNVAEVVGDQNYFGPSLRHLSEHFPTAPIYQQSTWMRQYIQEFYRDAAHQRIAHAGDRTLAAHVAAIEGTKTRQGYWHLEKLRNSRPMDAGTAAIMATGRARLAGPDTTAGGDVGIFFI